MRIARQLGLVLVVICALSVVAVSSASASPTFLSHPLGLILLKADNNQVLSTPGSGAAVSCKALKHLLGNTIALQALNILVLVDYESCEVEGLGVATITPVHYLIDANGEASLLNNVTVTAGGGLCVITIPASKNHNLKTVKFTNNSNGSLLVEVTVAKVTTSGAGLGCKYAEESNGTEEGIINASVDPKGALRWDP